MPEQDHTPIEVVTITHDELITAIESITLDRIGMTGLEFVEAVRQRQEFDDPTVQRVELLAQALIESN